MPIGGSSTFIESQFNVLKDAILNRTKEFNVNALSDKLLVYFNAHYQDKLISAANGSVDGVYHNRFLGKSKSSNQRVGNKVNSVCREN